MQYGVILDTVYRAWLGSGFFALLARLRQPAHRAYENHWLVIRLRRENRVQAAYESSLFSGVIRFILNLICKILAAISKALQPAWESSLIVRLGRGSFVLKLEFLLGAFVCLMFVVPHDYWNNIYALLAALGFLLLYLISAGVRKRRLLYPEKLGLPLALFAVALCVSLLFSHNRSDSLRILLFFVAAYVLAYVIAAVITDEGKLEKLLAFIYLSVFLVSVYALMQRVLNLVQPDALYTDLTLNAGVPGRVTATLDNPNNYAEFVVLLLPLCAAFAGTRKNQLLGAALLIGLAVPVVGCVMSYSRSGWISLALAVFVYIWLRNKKLIPCFIVLALLAVPFLPDSVITRLSSMLSLFGGSSGSGVDASFSHRLSLWEGVVKMLGDYGITGIGLGPKSFAMLFPQYSTVTGVVHTQSQYFEMLLEVGIAGFVSSMWLMLKCIKDCVIARRSASGAVKPVLIACAAALTGICFSFTVEYVWFYPRDLFAYFIVLGVAYAAVGIVENKKRLEAE